MPQTDGTPHRADRRILPDMGGHPPGGLLLPAFRSFDGAQWTSPGCEQDHAGWGRTGASLAGGAESLLQV